MNYKKLNKFKIIKKEAKMDLVHQEFDSIFIYFYIFFIFILFILYIFYFIYFIYFFQKIYV